MKRLALLLTLLALGGCFLHNDLVEGPPNTASAEKCGECHPIEFDEWKGSGHAEAYKSEYFKQQTDHYKVEKCIPCHTAASTYKVKEVQSRGNHLEEGVNCISCHLTDDGRLGGPHLVIPAHYTKMSDPYYLRSEMCGKCHVEHLQEWEKSLALQPAQKQEGFATCQDCHMPASKRKTITHALFKLVHWELNGKQHSFIDEVPKPKSEEEEEKSSWIKVQNSINRVHGDLQVDLKISHSIPHSLPSGIFGFKAVTLVVAVKDVTGRSLSEQTQTFYAEESHNIKPGETFKKRFTFPQEALLRAEYLEIRLQRRKSRMDFGRVLHEEQHRL